MGAVWRRAEPGSISAHAAARGGRTVDCEGDRDETSSAASGVRARPGGPAPGPAASGAPTPPASLAAALRHPRLAQLRAPRARSVAGARSPLAGPPPRPLARPLPVDHHAPLAPLAAPLSPTPLVARRPLTQSGVPQARGGEITISPPGSGRSGRAG